MNEDSMAGRPFWGWFKHRLEEFRKNIVKVDEDFNIQPICYDKRTELTTKVWWDTSFFTLWVMLINCPL